MCWGLVAVSSYFPQLFHLAAPTSSLGKGGTKREKRACRVRVCAVSAAAGPDCTAISHAALHTARCTISEVWSERWLTLRTSFLFSFSLYHSNCHVCLTGFLLQPKLMYKRNWKKFKPKTRFWAVQQTRLVQHNINNVPYYSVSSGLIKERTISERFTKMAPRRGTRHQMHIR